MKRSAIIFLLVLSITVHSQSYKELNTSVQNYYTQGNYGLAMVFAEQATNQAKKEFGERDTSYAKALNNLAMIYQKRLRYLDAERTFQKALKIKEIAIGTSNFSYSTTLINLADLFKSHENFPKALEYYQLAENIDKKIVGEQNEVYASDIANIGRVYYFLDDIPKALEYLTKASKIRESVLGKDNGQFAVNQIYLADAYSKAGDFSKADSFYRFGLTILSYKVGAVHPLFLGGLRQMSVLYKNKGDMKTADSLVRSALSIIEPRYTRKSIIFLDFLSDLAELKLLQGDLVKAEDFAIEVYNGRKELLDPIHPDINRSALLIAKIFFKQDRFEESASMISEYFARVLDIRQILFPTFSVSNIKDVEKGAEEAFCLYNSIFITQMKSNGEVRQLAFNNYRILSILNPSKYWFNKQLLESKYFTDGENDFVFWQRHAEYYGNLKLLPLKEFVKWNENMDTIFKAVNATASILSADSVFAYTFIKFNFDWKEYLKTLKKDEAVVVIIRGETNTEKYPGEIGYGVLVLNGSEEGDPKFFGIFDGNRLEEEVLSTYKKTPAEQRGKKFYKDFWGEISATIQDKRKILVKRIGVYKEIAIELLIDEVSCKTLGEIYQLELE